MPKNFGDSKKCCTFAPAIEKQYAWDCNDIGIWCNGNTTDSGPVIPGSSPGIPTSSSGILLKSKIGIWCNGNTTDSGPVIPGSSPGIPTREHLSFRKMLFSYIYLLGIGENFAFYYVLQKKRGGVVELWHTLLFDFDKIFYLFSASIALIFSFTSFKSSLSFSTLRFISSTRLLPFLLAALRKPRLFS